MAKIPITHSCGHAGRAIRGLKSKPGSVERAAAKKCPACRKAAKG